MSRVLACDEWAIAVCEIPSTAEVTLGALDRVPYSLACVHPRVSPIDVAIRNALLRDWYPRDERELSLAGQCFAELLYQLYDGRQWMLLIEPEGDVLEFAGWAPERIGFTKAHTWSALDADGFEWERDCWQCPKSVLKGALPSVWTPHGPHGYAVRRAEAEEWRSCFDEEQPAARLGCWLTGCLFIFEHLYHGAGIRLVSRDLTLETVEAALAQSNAHRALQRLCEES